MTKKVTVNQLMKSRSLRMKFLKDARKNLEEGSSELDRNLREFAALYNANQSDAYLKLGGRPPEQLSLVLNDRGLAIQLTIK